MNPPPADKQALLAELEISRRQLEGALHSLRPGGVRRSARASVGRHPAAWVLGSACTGLILARILVPRRRSRADRKSSLADHRSPSMIGLRDLVFQTLLAVGRPLLVRFAEQRIALYMDR